MFANDGGSAEIDKATGFAVETHVLRAESPTSAARARSFFITAIALLAAIPAAPARGEWRLVLHSASDSATSSAFQRWTAPSLKESLIRLDGASLTAYVGGPKRDDVIDLGMIATPGTVPLVETSAPSTVSMPVIASWTAFNDGAFRDTFLATDRDFLADVETSEGARNSELLATQNTSAEASVVPLPASILGLLSVLGCLVVCKRVFGLA